MVEFKQITVSDTTPHCNCFHIVLESETSDLNLLSQSCICSERMWHGRTVFELYLHQNYIHWLQT